MKETAKVLKEYTGVLGFVCAIAFGCASYTPPDLVDSPDYLRRIESKSDRNVKVSAVVLSDKESEQALGTRLTDSGIQPIWVEIENRHDQEFILMLNSVDANYFSPSEAAWISRNFGESGIDKKVQHFFERQIPVVIASNSTEKGFVYTNLDPGGKAFGITLVGDRELRRFEFVQEIPGLRMDWMQVDFDSLYSPDEIDDLKMEELRAYLKTLPCCVLGGDRETKGDPVNIVIVGDGLHVLAVLVRMGWDMTETLTQSSVWRTIKSSVFGIRYRTSPVSPLYLFGRHQDVALQKARGTVNERNHMRLWLAPVTSSGQEVWVGQISRDIGVKLSSKTLVTHKIDPIIDESRMALLLDAAASQSMERLAFVKGVGVSSYASPRTNYTLDPYYTDGLRLVLFLSEEFIALDHIGWVDWEIPPGPDAYLGKPAHSSTQGSE
jgi:hypothetical protein